jgi:hypothetical protein
MSDIEARIEELAKIAYGVKGTLREGSWATLQPFVKDTYRAIARTLYAEAMKDAARLARAEASPQSFAEGCWSEDARVMARHIAITLEVKAQEARDGS